jgi:hypothetical protein
MTAGPRPTGPTGAKAPRPARTAVGVAGLAAVAGLVAGVGLAAITIEPGCRPGTPAVGRAAASPAAAADVPVIGRPDGRLVIDVPHSRVDRAVVRTQQDANDLWRILYGTPYPTGRPTP